MKTLFVSYLTRRAIRSGLDFVLATVLVLLASACSSNLTESKARNTVQAWLTQNKLELLNWKGLIKVSDNEMIAKADLKYGDAWTGNPPLAFTFTRTADNSWALTKIATEPGTRTSQDFGTFVSRPVFIKVE